MTFENMIARRIRGAKYASLESSSVPSITKTAVDVLGHHPELFRKLASGLLASQFPSAAAALQEFQARRAQRAAGDAEQDARRFPALHATQPAMAMARLQMAYGSDPSFGVGGW